MKNYKNEVYLKWDDQGKLVHFLSLWLLDGRLRYSRVFVRWSWLNVSDGVLLFTPD